MACDWRRRCWCWCHTPCRRGLARQQTTGSRQRLPRPVSVACSYSSSPASWSLRSSSVPPALATFGAYALVWLGTQRNPLSSLSAKVGDLSCGVYLYGWPVQQLVRLASASDAPWRLLAWSAPITLVGAWLSLRLVEAPALRLKAPVNLGLRRLAAQWCGGAAIRRRVRASPQRPSPWARWGFCSGRSPCGGGSARACWLWLWSRPSPRGPQGAPRQLGLRDSQRHRKWSCSIRPRK